MKTKLFACLLLICLLFTFVSCDLGFDLGFLDRFSPEKSETDDVEVACNALSLLAEKSYSMVKVDIVTVTGDISLQAKYEVTATEIKYEIEVPNELSLDGELADEMKSVKKGSAIVENGKVTRVDDEDVIVPPTTELTGAFRFSQDNFENATVSDGSFTADVISSAKFFGNDRTVSDLKVTVTYTEAAFVAMVLTYTTENATVKTTYTFAA